MSLALLELDPPGASGTSLELQDQVGARRDLPLLFSISPLFSSHFSPGSSDKIDKRNGKMKRRGSSKGGRRNFETWKKIPQPSPTEKQKLDVVSHSALLSSSPGTPAGPQKQLSSRRASEEVSVELCTSSQAERNMQNGLCQVEDRKKGCRTAFLPPHPVPAFWGRSKIPKQSNQHNSEGACPPPSPFLGEPHPRLGPELH